jgi:hypothetical protein
MRGTFPGTGLERGFSSVRRSIFAAVALAAAVAVHAAGASQVISTSAVTGIELGVDAKGEAMLTYTAGGKVVHVLAYGAVNAVAPRPGGKQVAFKLDYSGGQTLFQAEIAAATRALRALQAQLRQEQGIAAAHGKHYTPTVLSLSARIQQAYATIRRLHAEADGYFRTFTCPRYTGPRLAWFVTGCTAPDGSFWAVQAWPRQLPDYGAAPTGTQGDDEVHLAHWTGSLPQLTVHTDWSYAGRYQHLFGALTYAGKGVYGFKSTATGAPLDSFGRNLYLDAYDADYGTPGWARVNSWLTHGPGGTWCYGLYPHGAGNHTGDGTKYRLSVIGPGVTPDVMVEFAPPDPATRTADRAGIAALHDPLCTAH